MSGQIRCLVVETDASSDELWQPQRRGFRELLPWADPYIAQLLLKHLMQSTGDAPSLSFQGAGE